MSKNGHVVQSARVEIVDRLLHYLIVIVGDDIASQKAMMMHSVFGDHLKKSKASYLDKLKTRDMVYVSPNTLTRFTSAFL